MTGNSRLALQALGAVGAILLMSSAASQQPADPDADLPVLIAGAAEVSASRLAEVLRETGGHVDMTLPTRRFMPYQERVRSTRRPIHYAARSGSAEGVRNLINAGADFDAQTLNGTTPLWQAVISGNPATVRVLLEAGADVNARDSDGATALDQAIEEVNAGEACSAQIARMLVDAGGELGATGRSRSALRALGGLALGAGAIRAAAEGVPTETIERLVRAGANALDDEAPAEASAIDVGNIRCSAD